MDFFEKRKKEIIQINDLSDANDVYFEIVKIPDEYDPFYKIKTFELFDKYIRGFHEYDDYKYFKVTKDGKKFYVIVNVMIEKKGHSEYVSRKIPVDKWIKSALKKIKR